MRSTFIANLEDLPDKIKLKVKKKKQTGHPTMPKVHQLDKYKMKDKGKDKEWIKEQEGLTNPKDQHSNRLRLG